MLRILKLATLATGIALLAVVASSQIGPVPTDDQECSASCSSLVVPGVGYGIWSDCLSRDGGCPPLGWPCSWTCRLKIMSDGEEIDCPTTLDPVTGFYVIDHEALAADPARWPECWDWHPVPGEPTWETDLPYPLTPDLPGDGMSEYDLSRSWPCGSDVDETLKASASNPAVTASTVLSLSCSGCTW